ncbi:MAG: N-acetylmuramoyl-L-alanine amidase [Corynebacteriales bacterium]|nr:N-acetylmuramoyl-L-alanine amidase [Mycobacteriales bacterium]
MRVIKRGDTGPAAAEIRDILVELQLLPPGGAAEFDAACELAVRAFQQERGLSTDGLVGPETWRNLVSARYRLGDRVLNLSISAPLTGDDIRSLQERLLEIGYNVGRPDGVFSQRTADAVRSFQRECGLPPDGVVGPETMRALRRLARKVVGGRPQLLRESAALNRSGPRMRGKRLVIDPAFGGEEPGWVSEGVSEAEVCYDLALRLQGRFMAIGGHADLTRGPQNNPSSADRADFANIMGADLLISLHIDHHDNPEAEGLATYHFGTGAGVCSTAGERLAGLVQREIVARTGIRDCHTHAKSWEILRLTRMPAVQIELGYLTNKRDRERLTNSDFRDTVAEAILIAVQRIFLPQDADVHTGTLDLSALRTLQLNA